jgi:prepilin peptidase CpaA
MSSEYFNFIGLNISKVQLNLVLPLLLASWMAWHDMRTNRIPNYLTLGGVLAGLGYQLGFHGWTGLANGFLGMSLGFTLLIFFYWKGGLGAGDVKALAALGAWLGPRQTLYLFVYMGISGVILIFIILWWRGLLLGKIRQLWAFLLNWVLTKDYGSMPPPAPTPGPQSAGIPYAMAMAMGMAILCWRGLTS